MNRGVLQSSSLPVQQMMGGGSPNWWSIINNTLRPPLPNHQLHHHQPPPPPPFLAPLPTLFPSPPPPAAAPSLQAALSASSWTDNNHHDHQLPESWSQLLLGGLVGEEDKYGLSGMQQLLSHASASPSAAALVYDVKQENPTNSYVYGGGHGGNVEFPAKSCVTSLSSNMLDFSNKSGARHPPPDHSSECNSTATGGAPTKKARIQPSSTQSTFKVRKEKLGDRITALHQLVSPFGKTDTASVLLEAIGYIRFLQSQIEALSLPYLGNGSGNNMRHQQQSFVQTERNCLFPEDPGQLLNDNCLKRNGTSDHNQPQDGHEEPKKDLRSRGLCLVPISCTLQVGSDNGADYWAPTAFGGGFRS